MDTMGQTPVKSWMGRMVDGLFLIDRNDLPKWQGIPQQTNIAMETGPFIVDLPIKNGDFR